MIHLARLIISKDFGPNQSVVHNRRDKEKKLDYENISVTLDQDRHIIVKTT